MVRCIPLALEQLCGNTDAVMGVEVQHGMCLVQGYNLNRLVVHCNSGPQSVFGECLVDIESRRVFLPVGLEVDANPVGLGG